MASRVAFGDGPVSFFLTDGRQVSVPLSVISFDDNGVASVGAPYTTPEYAALGRWIAYLARVGRLYPGPTPAPKTALIIKAIDEGMVGNNIQVAIDYPDPNQPARFNVTVTEEVTYAGLTLAMLLRTLGTTNAPGLKPGPVVVRGTIAPLLPDNATLTRSNGAAAVTAGTTTTPATRAFFTVLAGTATAFVLEARKAGEWGNDLAVTISDADATAGTFTLVARWRKPASNVTSANALQSSSPLATLAEEIAVTAPAGATSVFEPQPGTILLGGGAEPAKASRAVVAKA